MTHVANVTIQSSQVSADATDFVFYVDLSDLPTTEFWGTVANGGGDIRVFKSDGTTELAREVVSCDTATDTGELWVKFSGTLSSSVDTTVQIHADGVSSEPAVGATYGRNAVWSSYVAAYHFEIDGTDSAGNSDFDLTGATFVSAGIGRALSLDGVTAYQAAISEHSPDGITLQTISQYENYGIKTNATFGVNNGTIQNQYMAIALSGAGTGGTSDWGTTVYLASGGTPNWLSVGRVSRNTDVWSTATIEGAVTQAVKLYLDSDLDRDETSTELFPTAQDNLSLGQARPGFEIQPGIISEARILWGVLSPEWIATEYNNQSSPSTFYTITAAAGGPTVSPFGMQILGQQFGPIAAARLNGVMQ